MKPTSSRKPSFSSPDSPTSWRDADRLRRRAKYLIVLAAVCCLFRFGLELGSHAMPIDEPRVNSIAVRKLTTSDDKARVKVDLEISGDHFGPTSTPVVVTLVNLETGAAVAVDISSHDSNQIVASVQLPIAKKPVKYQFRVTVNGKSAIKPERLSDYTLEVGKEEKKVEAPTPFEITYETFKSDEYPNLRSLVITNKNQNSKPGFSSNPSLMKVDIVPPGATNVVVAPGSSPYQMFVTFLAPENFEVKGVAVTVFDPASTLGNNNPVAFTTPFLKDKPSKQDPNQPTISNIEVLSLQRRSGFGMVKIEGSGFGDYRRAPLNGERDLLCCIKRPADPDFTAERLGESGRSKDPAKPVEVCNLVEDTTCSSMLAWRNEIEKRVNVTLSPRNPNLRVERTFIIYIDDKLINVYFEFTRFEGFSQPFRLAGASVTVNKGAVQPAKTSDEAGEFSAVVSSPKTFVASKEIGPQRDPNLEYRYAVMEQKDASRLFGKGVGGNFYIIQLAVVNKGTKKVAVPLGSIQAEIEWSYYQDEPPNGKQVTIYEEGPPTLPPLPLGAVSGYFDAFQKSEGKWARIFNILDGVTTLGTGLVPVFGRNIERPTSILAGSFIPGLRKAVGDLSSEQLQRLTTMSWENVEEVPAGASISKFIYIPRADQLFGSTYIYYDKDAKKNKTVKVVKQIMNVRGLEVSGFEVVETEEKLATPQP